MSLNPIRQVANAVANAATTVTGTLKAGKDYTVSKINQNPTKTAIISGTSGLAFAGASAAVITLVSVTAGIALAAVAALAIAFAAYNAVKAHLANKKIAQAPVAAAPAAAAPLTAHQIAARDAAAVDAAREVKRNFTSVLAQLPRSAADVAPAVAADAADDAEGNPEQLNWLERFAATVLAIRA